METNSKAYPSPIISKNEDGSYTCILSVVDRPTFSGRVIPVDVAAKAIDALSVAALRQPVYGHFGQDHFINVMDTLDAYPDIHSYHDRVCCSYDNFKMMLDVKTLTGEEVPGLVVVADVRPTGPKMNVFMKLLEATPTDFAFGVRGSYVRYPKVFHEIITWDVIAPMSGYAKRVPPRNHVDQVIGVDDTPNVVDLPNNDY